eukprot:CAMPEP_0178569310 /NCGR_PEP_ID=MMETSP0697-20121206/16417_1 /TAXON_ID=265572 /ORGANISM="Extubocellulus spinifer, Strain CCMP396" /LENGTH=205 /DNA_ID=CAMNT_0020203555 /DNA_START=74 /DNA_END=688 /DNA_ORIENTATION=+
MSSFTFPTSLVMPVSSVPSLASSNDILSVEVVSGHFYVASFVGDLFDGVAARKFDQCSTYGGLLDMVTDRCATTGLLYILAGEYDAKLVGSITGAGLYRLAFLLLMLLDISSHWCQMYSTASLQQHHKSDDGNTGRFFLVRWYYHYYYFFGYCCVGAEFTYVALYGLAHVAENDTLLKALGDGMLMACAPACVVKQVVNVFQLTS